MFGRFLKDESGATAIEYGLIVALVAAGIIGGASFAGSSMNAQFDSIASTIDP